MKETQKIIKMSETESNAFFRGTAEENAEGFNSPHLCINSAPKR